MDCTRQQSVSQCKANGTGCLAKEIFLRLLQSIDIMIVIVAVSQVTLSKLYLDAYTNQSISIVVGLSQPYC